MNPYEKLANGIIKQAADDYRSAALFLKKHPRTMELEQIVIQQRKQRKARNEELSAKNLPRERKKASREENLLTRIATNERMMKDAERFFYSEWFAQLTSLDGHTLLGRIKKELEGG